MPDTRSPFFFGYGSLVNTATHDYDGARPARLHGWRRIWCHTDLRAVAFLSVQPDAKTVIDGMIAPVPKGDWRALDQREWAYSRLPANSALDHDITEPLDIAFYAVPTRIHSTPPIRHPILLSYLDVVVQGYLRAFGPDGVRRFFDTTDGWDAPILNDRAAPRYPRHQRLSAPETALVDRFMAKQGGTLL